MAEGTQDDKTKTQTPKVNTTPAKPNKGANGPANGEVPQGTTDPNAGHGDTVQKTAPAQARTTLVEVHLNDDVRNDPNARVGSVVGPAVGRNRYGGTPGDPWGTRARLDAQRQAQHERNMQAQAAQRQAWRDSSARMAKDFAAKKAAIQEAINKGDFTDLKTISADTWKAHAPEDPKDGAGSRVLDANGNPTQKTFRNEGSVFDAAGRAKEVAALEKWWAEEGVATSQGKIPKGVFDEKGKLNTEGLTTDQFGALQKIMENSQARLAPLRERVKLNDARNYMRDSEYLSSKGVKVWNTATGERLLSKEQVSKMAREMRMTDVKSALEGMAPAWNAAKSVQTDANGDVFTDPKDQEFYQKKAFEAAKAKEADLVQKMRQLGFRADQIADDSGNIDYGRIAAALGEKAPAPEAAAPAPKAVQKPAAKTTAAPATKAEKPVGEADAIIAGIRAGKGAEGSAIEQLRARSVDPLAAAGIRVRRPAAPVEDGPEATAAPAVEVPDEAWAKRAGQTYREIMGIPESTKPFSPSDLLGVKSLPADDGRPRLRARTSAPRPVDTIRATGRAPADPMVGEFQRRGLNPLQTATMIAGAVPAGITQMAGGTTRVLSGGDLKRGFTDIVLGGATVAGGQVAGSATLKSGRGSALPVSRYSGGVMPGSGSAKAVARRMGARAAEGEGVINPMAMSRPLGRAEAARVEAGYRRSAQTELNVKAAKAREAEAAKIHKFERAARRRAAAEREDIRKAHAAGLRAQRAEQRRQVQDRIRRNERKAGYPEPAKNRRHN